MQYIFGVRYAIARFKQIRFNIRMKKYNKILVEEIAKKQSKKLGFNLLRENFLRKKTKVKQFYE